MLCFSAQASRIEILRFAQWGQAVVLLVGFKGLIFCCHFSILEPFHSLEAETHKSCATRNLSTQIPPNLAEVAT